MVTTQEDAEEEELIKSTRDFEVFTSPRDFKLIKGIAQDTTHANVTPMLRTLHTKLEKTTKVKRKCSY